MGEETKKPSYKGIQITQQKWKDASHYISLNYVNNSKMGCFLCGFFLFVLSSIILLQTKQAAQIIVVKALYV